MAATDSSNTTTQTSVSKPECSICHAVYQEPKLLPCFHTFCEVPCLERLVVQESGGLFLTCPTCQQQVLLPENGVAGLPPDLHAENLMRGHGALTRGKLRTDCENCKKKPAIKYCQQCNKNMCDKCIKMHQMWENFSDHKLTYVAMSNVTESLKSTCAQHHSKEATTYCDTCSTLICEDCTAVTHRNHEYNSVTEAFPRHKEDVVCSLTQVKEKIKKIEDAQQVIAENEKELQDHRVKVEAEINRDIDKLHKILETQRQEMIASLDSLVHQKQIELHEKRTTADKMHIKMGNCLEYTNSCLETETQSEFLKMKKQLHEQTNQIARVFDPVSIEPKFNLDIQWIFNKQLCQACETVGSVQCVNIVEETIYKELDDINFRVTANESYEIGKILSVNNQHTQPPSECPYEIVEYRQEPEVEKSAIVIPANGPCGVTTNSKGQLVTVESGKNRVMVTNFRGKEMFNFGKQGSGKGKLKKPCGIAIDNDDNIYVVDNNMHRIQKFTPNGRFIAAVGQRGNRRLQFVYPIGICFDKTLHRLYVCDQLNNRIQVISTDLEFLAMFGSRGGANGMFDHPKNVATDSSGNVYVTDCGNNRIQVLTSEGQFLRTISMNDSLRNPFAIGIDSKDNVYVSELDIDCIKVLNRQGDYQKSIGVRGKNLGQFCDIKDIDFSDSIMIVSDSSNNRLQVLLV